MVGIAEVVGRWLGTHRTAAMAERVAGRSRLAAWQRVHERLLSLSPSEARGYVRARAIPVVKEETARLIEQEGRVVARRRSDIEESALDMLVEMISAQVARSNAQTSRKAA